MTSWNSPDFNGPFLNANTNSKWLRSSWLYPKAMSHAEASGVLKGLVPKPPPMFGVGNNGRYAVACQNTSSTNPCARGHHQGWILLPPQANLRRLVFSRTKKNAAVFLGLDLDMVNITNVRPASPSIAATRNAPVLPTC